MTIGEFSELSGLTPKRLRGYADAGLLPPVAVDPDTGYRYYSAAQLSDARLIDALRRADLPLSEIRSLLQDRTPSRLDTWAGHIRADAERRHEALRRAHELLASGPDAPLDLHDSKGRQMVKLETAARTEIGRVRENNEDSVLIADRMLAVADGMGGAAGGEVASRLAADVVGAAFGGSSADEMEAALRAANWVVWDRATGTPELRGMGTTLCAAGLLADGSVVVANVGDSRAYLASNGSVDRLTDDHTIAADLVRQGQLTDAEAACHPHRHVLTRALGVAPSVAIDRRSVAVDPGDRLLLCTDGLFGEVGEDDIGSLLASELTPAAIADSLVDLALAKSGRDNITVVVAEVQR